MCLILLGMPTSTTVSIVFELLGAAVAISLIKISQNDAESISAIWNYINYEKASLIIFGILLSVVVAFSVGALCNLFPDLSTLLTLKKDQVISTHCLEDLQLLQSLISLLLKE